MKWIALCAVALSLGGCGEEPAPQHYASDGAKLARVCHDGTHIWLYTDGTYHTSWNQEVTDVDKVCQ